MSAVELIGSAEPRVEPLDLVRRQRDRKALIDRHMRDYARRGFAICLTDGIEGDAAKRVSAKNWDKTEPLGDPGYAAGLFATRCLDRNPGLVLGPSNLIGVDVDGDNGYEKLREFAEVPKTVVVVTGGGGWHLYFRPPAPTRVTKIEFTAERVKLTHGAGYLIAPPAIHPNGATYRFLAGYEPWSTEIATFPAELLQQLEVEQHRDDEAARHDDESVLTVGERHATLLRIAGAMRRAGAGRPEIEAALLTLNARRCVPPKPEHVVRELSRDVVDRYAPGARP